MKFPRLSRKTWIAIGLVVVLVVLVSWSVKEGFESNAQFTLFHQKLQTVIKSPHFEQLKTMYPPPPGGGPGADLPIVIKFILPLQAVGLYGDVIGNDLQIKKSQLESMLNGTFPVDSVLTLEKAYQVAQVMQREGEPPIDKSNFMNDGNSRTFYINFPKGLYYLFAKGQVSPNSTREEAEAAQKQLNDPNDKLNKPWTEQEKEWLRKAAGMLYTIIPDTPAAPAVPSPSAPPSSAMYSASCSKCSVINNQITCACDVLPK